VRIAAFMDSDSLAEYDGCCGQTISVKKESNLYFSATKKKLEKINPARLEEILLKLVSNFEERKDLDLIPGYWNPYGFFCYKKLQNLCKKA
jgi:hypothetical protein